MRAALMTLMLAACPILAQAQSKTANGTTADAKLAEIKLTAPVALLGTAHPPPDPDDPEALDEAEPEEDNASLPIPAQETHPLPQPPAPRFDMTEALAAPPPIRKALPLGGELIIRSLPGVPSPVLAVSGPGFVEWGAEGFAAPAVFFLSSNYLSMIASWELLVYRGTDSRKVLQRFRGDVSDFYRPVVWNGRFADRRQMIRPGETLSYVLRVTDETGNVDETQPRRLIVARVTHPRQRETMAKLEAQRAIATERDGHFARRHIPLTGAEMEFRFAGLKDHQVLRFSGTELRRDVVGGAVLRQILPAGKYATDVTQDGKRLALSFSVGGARASLVPLEPKVAQKLSGDLAAAPARDGLEVVGTLPGRRLLRMAAGLDDPALSRVDPARDYALYRDPVSGALLLRLMLDATQTRWPRADRKPAEGLIWVAREALIDFAGGTLTRLPDADLEAGSVRVELGVGESRIALNPGQDFDVEPLRGLLALTDSGQHLLSIHRDAPVLVSYRARMTAEARPLLATPAGREISFRDASATIE